MRAVSKLLSPHLHRGEAEAIALAADLAAGIVNIDEREGMEFGAQAGLSVVGVLFVDAALEANVLAIAGE
jgi:predicted nucleic acid-binding protein